MERICLTILSIIFTLSLANAQIVTGQVTDSDAQPLPGAFISNISQAEHTHSDYNGFFKLNNTTTGDTLQLSFLGFEMEEIIVKDVTTPLQVTMIETKFLLNEIVVSPELDALNILAEVNLKTNPVTSSQEILQKVPGLFIGQHAGGGKAEQIFLRGFDIDHGTDINITVDGMPVNMVSHAHGQGYADLHFVIPETIDNIDFGKGPYEASQGNFATAGYVNFKTKDRLKNNQVQLEVGQFNSQRFLGMLNFLKTDKHNLYLATEYSLTDGYFESPQNFYRFNSMLKYTGQLSDKDRLQLTASHFSSEWNASGQIPQRLVDNGTITRFGAVDDTEGGNTSRTNFLLDYSKTITNNSFIKNTAYYTLYDFELYSNFTFFLNDPINGDQIRQRENRQLFGWTSAYHQEANIGDAAVYNTAGVGFRNDQSFDNELSNTLNRRTTLSSTQFGNINETNVFAYVNSNISLGKLTINPALRYDIFRFGYEDFLQNEFQTAAISKTILSPKLNILYNQTDALQLYLKLGKGFHSNDSRVVVAQNGEEILPAAYGSDLGFIWKPKPNMLLNVGGWYLLSEQEFVYVGDEGVVEPSGQSQRYGVDISVRHQPLSWLHYNLDANYTVARAIDELEGESYIPLAPDLTVAGSVSITHPSGFYQSTSVRYLDNRPANEDNSIVAKGYTVVDANMGYQWKRFDVGISIQNLLNTEWNETQFATTSRLSYEVAPVEEIHFTPGTPFSLRAKLAILF